MGTRRQGAASMQDVEHPRTLERAATGNRVEVGTIGRRRPPRALRNVENDRCGSAVELVAKARRRYAQPGREGSELDRNAIRVEPVEIEQAPSVAAIAGSVVSTS
jgi:hypothetical protein